MKNHLYFISTFCAGFFCWVVFFVNAAFASESHEKSSSSGLPQLDASTFPSQLFWLFVTFVVLYVIFSKKSLPEISNVIKNRKGHIDADLASAEKLKLEAQSSQQNYEANLDDARKKATKTLADAQDKIKIKAEQQNEIFRQKIEKDIDDLEKRLIKTKDDAMDGMNIIAAEIASEAVKKIAGITSDIEQAKTAIEAINGTKAKAA